MEQISNECIRLPHNQTVNILSHTLGSLIAIATLSVLALEVNFSTISFLSHSTYRPLDWPFTIFYSSEICLALSAIFHISMSHSQHICERCNSFDYIGIIVLISGTYWPSVYYGFVCQPHIRLSYCLVVGMLAAGTIYFVTAPSFRTISYRSLRTRVFLSLGFSGLIPIGHSILQDGLVTASQVFALHWLGLGAAFYTIGAIIYIGRFPERYTRHTFFDIYGSSHQLMHISVLLAIWAHGELEMQYSWRQR